MPRYNVHKRSTLDRLTQAYQFRMRELIRKHIQDTLQEFVDALDRDDPSMEPDTIGIIDSMARIFESHRDKVIHVGVSDGIQEVSPEHRLNAWDDFPLEMPVEETLSVDLASKRDALVKGIKRQTIAANTYKISDLVNSVLDSYLFNIRKTYRKVAKNWMIGESSIEDVTSALGDALKKTDSESERIFRTETTNYFNESRHEYFSENTGVDYMQLYAVTDFRLSKICEDRHEAVVTISEARLKKYMPAFHPHCRTIQRPLISALPSHKALIDKGLQLRESFEASWTPAVF